MNSVKVVDSHTGGEPTRVVISGGPDLGRGPLPERLETLKTRFDDFRSAVINEPRGSSVIVGALLCEPVDPSALAGVLFFNNAGVLGMCGHGTIGLVVTLAHLGRAQPGPCRIETPVGTVVARLHGAGKVSVDNVPSFRTRKGVTVEVDGIGRVSGDVAWGGNWFFITQCPDRRLELRQAEELTQIAWKIRGALSRQGVTGPRGEEIDHIELVGPSETPGVDCRSFTLCPGKAYDRSPCGTGTSAKMACLADDGRLREGQIWRQESVLGSVFEGSIIRRDGAVLPTITGSAYIVAESTLLFDPRDPFASGIRI